MTPHPSESALSANQTRPGQVKVNDLRHISTAKRFMLGMMTGNAYMELDIECVQLQSNRVTGARKIKTFSSAWEGIFAAVTSEQVHAVWLVVRQDARRLGI